VHERVRGTKYETARKVNHRNRTEGQYNAISSPCFRVQNVKRFISAFSNLYTVCSLLFNGIVHNDVHEVFDVAQYRPI